MERKTAEVFAGLVSFLADSGSHSQCVEYLIARGVSPENICDAFNKAMEQAKCSDRFTVQDCSAPF